VVRSKEANIPALARLVDEGWDLIALVPSCVLMFKQELPLMFPEDPLVGKVRAAFFDPFEFLNLRHREGKLNTEFKQPLGKVTYHAACHQRVQNFGAKTRDILKLIPGTEVTTIERCSGHDGTYAVKSECHDYSMKIGRPVFAQIKRQEPDHYGSDCPIAARQLENGLGTGARPEHPISLVRKAYGI